MSHELYKSWILADEHLTIEQEKELNTHLETCPECSKIAAGWQGARQHMTQAGLAAPAPGFGLRWQKTLAERKLAKQKKNIRWLLFGLSLAAIFSFGGLAYVLTNTSALLEWLISTAASVERTLAWGRQIYLVISLWLSGLPEFVLPLAALLVISSGFAILVFLWVSVSRTLAPQGVLHS